MRHTLLTLVLLLGAAPLRAQFPAEIRGRVIDGASGAAIAAARLEVLGSGVSAVAAADRSFLLRAVPPGSRRIAVSAFGYRPREIAVATESGRSSWLIVELEPDPLALPGVVAMRERMGTAPGALLIERAEIEASGAHDLGELLRNGAGLVVTRRGGPGAPAVLSVRGGSADQVLVLVDGTPLNSLLTGEADLSTVPLEAVERVVVLRGAGSARYGPRALAGVVLVETRRAAGPEIGVSGGFGDHGERSVGFAAAGRHEFGRSALRALGSADWRAASGDFRYAVPEVRGGGFARRRNADAAAAQLLANLALETPGAELSARLDAYRLERGMPGSVVQPADAARQTQQRVGASAHLAGGPAALLWSASIELQNQQTRFFDPAPPLGAPYDETLDVDAAGATATVENRLGPTILAAGAELRRLGFASTMLAAGAPDAQTTRAAWAQARWETSLPQRARLELNAAMRADAVTGIEGVTFSPRAGAAIGVSRLTARLATGSAFSPPSLADQFFHEGVLARPNAELRPERVRAEVEAALEARDVALGAARLDLEVIAFRADIDDMILWFPDHSFVWRPENFDIRRHGWELAARARLPLANSELRAGLDRTNVEYLRGGLSGQVIYRPSLTARAGATATLASLVLELNTRYVGSRRTVPGSAINALEPYSQTDLRITRSFALRAWEAETAIAVENLFGRSAAMLTDYPYPGRSWRLGLRLQHRTHRPLPPAEP